MLYPTFLIYFWLLTYVLLLLEELLVASFLDALSCRVFVLFMRLHQSGVYRCEEQGWEQGSVGSDSCKVVGRGCDGRGGSREVLGVKAVGGGGKAAR